MHQQAHEPIAIEQKGPQFGASSSASANVAGLAVHTSAGASTAASSSALSRSRRIDGNSGGYTSYRYAVRRFEHG